jgi:hypothetical protein
MVKILNWAIQKYSPKGGMGASAGKNEGKRCNDKKNYGLSPDRCNRIARY